MLEARGVEVKKLMVKISYLRAVMFYMITTSARAKDGRWH
jgi:hypothetical protein